MSMNSQEVWTIILPPETVEAASQSRRRIAVDAFSVCSVAMLTTLIWWAWTYFVLGSFGGIQGRVTTLAGLPISGVSIHLPEVRQFTTTDSDGSFSIPDLQAGDYWVEVSSESSGVRRLVTVGKGSMVDIGEIPLHFSDE